MLPVLRWQPPTIPRAMQFSIRHSLNPRLVQSYNSTLSLHSNFHSTVNVDWTPSHNWVPCCGAQSMCISHSSLYLRRRIQQYCITPRLVFVDPFYSEWRHSNSNHHSDTYKQWQSGSGIAMATTLGLILCGNSKDDDRKFVRAAKDSDIDTMQSLLSSGVDVNCHHPLGWSALHAAVINRNWSVLKFLLENGADANVRDEFSTASRMATQRRVSSARVAMVRDLEFSSEINHYVSYSGFTPLHYAVVLGDEQLVSYLLEHGADPTLENNRGLRPGRYCTNDRMKKLLEEYTVKMEEKKLKERLEERRKFPLEDRLRQQIVGQEGPITTAAAAIRRREMGWADDDHPLVLLFLGSSGIGKTELAKQVANYIHRDNKKKGFIRLDMSEYQEKHEVAKLIGAPPGYVGYDQGGQLTSKLRECPNAVVLFDEVDKAHPDVLTVLLQLFDEGRLTDGQGKTIECKDAIFVMTSNLASDEIASHGLKLRREAEEAAREYRKTDKEPEQQVVVSREFKEQVVEPILKRHFRRDEFLGRINEMVYFLPFSRAELNQLVEKELEIWQERAKKRHSIYLTWDREVLDVLADGYNVKYGARSIQHEVERRVVNQLASAFEQQVIQQGNRVRLIVEGKGEGSLIGLQVADREKRQKVNLGHTSCDQPGTGTAVVF